MAARKGCTGVTEHWIRQLEKSTTAAVTRGPPSPACCRLTRYFRRAIHAHTDYPRILIQRSTQESRMRHAKWTEDLDPLRGRGEVNWSGQA
ncbi:hypothetical protein PanWU01x14_260480 [Parasponia andersonii]|uniref:Uncharacterized protein n=1 Tax=Parasponia andersonii TaxID=3476 RepID=A0A2P5B8V3_PARAD|nr:hypothetical protein PanWU01x14_260480 [Parasponia andersonii]